MSIYSFNNDYVDDGLKISSPVFNLPYRERPILFSTPMVEAILEGRKTQTRRIIKDSFNGCWTGDGWGTGHPCPNDPIVTHPGETITDEEGNTHIVDTPTVEAWFHCSTMNKLAKCPYGKVGDHLWVKETFAYVDAGEDSGYVYKASENGAAWAANDPAWKWKPSIFMPREASRIELEITDIRVERLLSISEKDAVAEGLTFEDRPNGRVYFVPGIKNYSRIPSKSYWGLWDSINGKDSHKINPWVWALKFKRINP